MRRCRRHDCLGTAALTLLVLLLPQSALAGGLQAPDRSGDAGPVERSSRVVSSNPAAMGFIDGFAVGISNALTLRTQRFEPEGDGEAARSTTLQTYPYVSHVNDAGTDWLHAGFTAELPWRYGADWPTDGPQRFDSIFRNVKAVHLTPAIAFTPVDWLHIGASASLVQTEFSAYRAIDFGPIVARQEGADPGSVPQQDPGNEGREFMEFSGNTGRWSVGVALEPGPWRIGASYHSPINLELGGTYELLIPRNEFYSDRYGGDISNSATFDTRWPSRAEFGLARSFDDSDFYAQLEWTHWSQIDDVQVIVEDASSPYDWDRTLPFDRNDTFEIRLGGQTPLSKTVSLDAEVGMETSAIPADQLSARENDAPKVVVGAGLRWAISEMFTLRTGYQNLFFLPRSVDGEAAGTYRQNLGLLETSISFNYE